MSTDTPQNHLRTIQTHERYLADMAARDPNAGCALCQKTHLQTFEHWFITENDYPYDRVATRHHMLVPKRHVTERELSDAECAELMHLKESVLAAGYQHLLESLPGTMSIPAHYHLHLMCWNSG